MHELKLLEMELELLQDNIQRVKKYVSENEEWSPSHSNVVGELKHRMVSLKQRLTITSKITTMYLIHCEKN